MDYRCSEADGLRYENQELEEQIERLEREKAELAKVEIKDGEVVIPKGEVKRIKAVAREREKGRKEAAKRGKEAAARRKLLGDPEMRVTIEIGSDAKIETLPDGCLRLEIGDHSVHLSGISQILQALPERAISELRDAEVANSSLVTLELRNDKDFERRGCLVL